MDEAVLMALIERLATTGCVVTSAHKGRHDGCFISYIAPCSMSPFRLLVMTSHETLTNQLVEQSRVVAVHPIARGQENLVLLFGRTSGRQEDKFASLTWRPGQTGAPILSGGLGYIEGRVIDSMDCGDHTARLVEPVFVELRDSNAVPLTTFELFATGLVAPSSALGNPWGAFRPRS
jgi:flavin reductase (DIM6/NTAB) family NADH-FMN oxidoreductase RutF